MTRTLLFASALAAALGASTLASAASTVSNVTSTLNANPAGYTGKCPTVITFTGTIKVEGVIDPKAPVEMGYVFLRSDGAGGPVKFYNIAAPGTQTVSTSWTLGSASLPSFAGWEQLKAYPTGHQGGFTFSFSDKADFKIACTRSPLTH